MPDCLRCDDPDGDLHHVAGVEELLGYDVPPYLCSGCLDEVAA